MQKTINKEVTAVFNGNACNPACPYLAKHAEIIGFPICTLFKSRHGNYWQPLTYGHWGAIGRCAQCGAEFGV